tara:strand:+ start:14 stop:1432 length:1419 start_codon:yes stop_codon:yes gene_type:complete
MKSKDYKLQEKIDKITLAELHRLDNFSVKKYSNFPKINLLSIIFPQLYYYLTSSIINQKVKPYSKNVYFPCVNSRYLNNNINFTKSVDNNFFKKKVSQLKKKIYANVPYAKISTSNVFFNIYNELENELSKRFIFRKKVLFKPLYLQNLNEQFRYLEGYLDQFAKKYNIKNLKYTDNFINYIRFYFSYEDIKIDDSQILFVGSNSLLENRITSANYLKKKRKVISFNHANYNTLIIDEPNQEYTEFTFCNYYVDYGSLNIQKRKLQTDFFAPKEIINLNNFKLKKIFSTQEYKNNKIIYVPDSFNGDHRAGCYREMDDRKYYKFQKKILNSNKDVLIKKHPKEKYFYNKNSLHFKKFRMDEKRILRTNLSLILKNYKLFIVDRISQAFFEIARSQAKILYLNIGRRRIKKKILQQIKKRALVIDVDPYKINKRKLQFLINKSLEFKIKKSQILDLACYSKNKKFDKLLRLIN